jgi:hypothetical protein
MLINVVRFQVDFMSGDANGAMYQYYKSQSIPSIMESSLSVCLRRLHTARNRALMCTTSRDYVSFDYQAISSNSCLDLDAMDMTASEIEAAKADRSVIPPFSHNIDCVVFTAFSWCHVEKGQQYYNTYWSVNDYDSRVHDPIRTPQDFDLNVKEIFFGLDNQAMWLAHSDTDWHSPLIVAIRGRPTKNLVFYVDKEANNQWYRGRAYGRNNYSSSSSSSSHQWDSWSWSDWQS